MAKRSGSKGSRSERKADRERARERRERGLPELPARKPLRARAATPAPTSSEDVTLRGDAPQTQRNGVPPFVWVVGGALLILVVAYFVRQKRDEALVTTPAPELPSASPLTTAPDPGEPSATVSQPAPRSQPAATDPDPP